MRAKTVTPPLIRSIAYDQEKRLLEIRLHSGAVDCYRGVPPEVHSQLTAAGSPDAYLMRQIRPNYACSRLLTV